MAAANTNRKSCRCYILAELSARRTYRTALIVAAYRMGWRFPKNAFHFCALQMECFMLFLLKNLSVLFDLWLDICKLCCTSWF
jgi:hypothetical protein